MASYYLQQCPTCDAMYRSVDLKRHVQECFRVRKKRDPHVFTAEANGHGPIKTVAFSKTIPDTKISLGARARDRKSGLETSILSAIAEGDDELATAYSKLSIDPETGTKRLTKEIVEAVDLKSKSELTNLAILISRARVVSLCFVLDCMKSHIFAVKGQIIDMVDQIEATGCTIAGLAFVGYKGWSAGENHFEILPFTTSIQAFEDFVRRIHASRVGNTFEDVVGRISKAVSLAWPSSSGTRVLFHVGDAPPHGRPKYHTFDDDYPRGHLYNTPLETLFDEIRRKNISYHFGRINIFGDITLEIFEKHNGKKIDNFDRRTVLPLCSSVTSAVSKSVIASTETSISSSRFGHLQHRRYTLDEREPNWSHLPCLEGTILSFQLPESISAIISFDKLEEEIYKCKLKIANNPFAKGSGRLAFYGKIIEKREYDVVFKEIISISKVAELDRKRYVTDLEVQTVAAKLAFLFNEQLSRTKRNPNIRLKFLMSRVVRITNLDGTFRFLSCEKRFRGATSEMVKYTNKLNYVLNAGTLTEEEITRLKLAQAFSHFSYKITGRYLLVCDLQGISTVDSKGQPTLLLTGPAIHCPSHCRFGKTNLRDVGIQEFFEKHLCNKFCFFLVLAKSTI